MIRLRFDGAALGMMLLGALVCLASYASSAAAADHDGQLVQLAQVQGNQAFGRNLSKEERQKRRAARRARKERGQERRQERRRRNADQQLRRRVIEAQPERKRPRTVIRSRPENTRGRNVVNDNRRIGREADRQRRRGDGRNRRDNDAVTNYREQRRIRRGSIRNGRVIDRGRIIGGQDMIDRTARRKLWAKRRENRRYRWRNRLRGKREILRRTDSFLVRRRRIRNLRGQYRYARSRRYWVREARFRNRFRRGRSIYWLPPVGVGLAIGAYVLASSAASYDDYYTTFTAPPVRRLDRRYTVDEVVADPEVRSAVRSVNIDIITFASGSDEIPESQIDRLEELADAIHETIKKRPREVFLIEGHTDAVGSDETNLELSERRAAAVHEALISEFGVPADNLESVGYGEQYLRIETDRPDQRNRRVVVRAIGALLADRR